MSPVPPPAPVKPYPASRVADVRRERDSVGVSPLANVMLVYIVVVVGRIGDILPLVHDLPLAKIVAAVSILIAVQSRASLSSLTVRSLTPVKLTLVFMGLIVISMSFSVLRHGTLHVITGTGLSVCVGLFLMVKSARNWRSVRTLLLGCVLSAVVLCIATELTRFAGRAGYTRDMDPNDFAFVFDALLPIVIAFASISRGAKRALYTAASLWIVLEILRTESRGGLLGLLVVAAILLILLPNNRRGRLLPRPSKAKIAARTLMIIMLGFVAWHVIPQSARVRFSTLSHPTSGYNTNLEDPTGRFSIWLQTLPLALQRPWGWGAGAFATVDGKYGGGRYFAPHNIYLQALIEIGVPGLIVLLSVIVSTFRWLKREAFAHPEPVDQDELERRAFARAQIASLVGICVSAFFLSELYSQALWALIILGALVGRPPAPHQKTSSGAAHRPVITPKPNQT